MNVHRPATQFFLIIALFFGHRTVAQRHYVYLQSEDRKPFYVRIGSEVHSSNATGYLIIPRLADSNFVFRVGYPDGDRPASVFPVQVANRDHGYLLSCSGVDCVLQDMQDASRIKGVTEEVKKEAVKTEVGSGTTDGFTNGLALAIGDPQLTRTELIKQEPRPAPAAPPKQERAVSVKEESVAKKSTTDKPAPQPEKSVVPAVITPPVTMEKKDSTPLAVKKLMLEPAIDTAVVVKSESKPPVKDSVVEQPVVVVKPVEDKPMLIAEKRDADGCTYTYLDGPGGRDTVTCWIAGEKVVAPEPVPTGLTEKAKTDITADLAPGKESKADSVVVAVSSGPVKVRTDCKARAVAKDVEALKKKLAGIRDEDEKVAAALAGVKARCYDTEQVKSLCGAFARNEGKYKLMDAAYPYVYDPSRYPELAGLLTDPYFVHRLKVLTGTNQRP